MASIINATTTNGLSTSADNSGSLQLATNNGTTAVTITTAQQVGIGVTPKTYSNGKALQINTAGLNQDAGGSFHITQNGYFNSSWKYIENGLAEKITYGSGIITFSNASNNTSGADAALTWSERMRIDSSGDLLVGTSTQNTLDGGKLQVLQSADNCAVFRTTTTNYQIVCQGGQGSNIGNQVLFRYGSSVVGNIVSTSSTTSYNTSSDYRLKENIAPMTGALATVTALKPCTYKWKLDGKDGQGFIAHELQAIVPDAVSGEKDAVETYTDKDGNEQTRIKPQGVDTSFLVATLTAAIQELKAVVDAQAVRIAELEGAK